MFINDIKEMLPLQESWTNEEIFKYLDGLMLKGDLDYFKEYNWAVSDVRCFFQDFTIPVEEFGAMGYYAEEDVVYHIGAIPE